MELTRWGRWGRLAAVLVAGGCATVLAVQATPIRAASDSAAEPAAADSKQAIEEVVRDYIMNNPEVILRSLRAHQVKMQEEEQKRAEQALEDSRDELVDDPHSPVAGNPDGDVTVVEFFDYNCGYCKRVLPALQAMLEKDDNVRYVFKEFPILSETSMTAARASLAVWNLAPEKHFEFHSELMSARGALTEDRILGLAETVGLDRDEVKKAMTNPEVAAEIQQNLELGQRIGVTGTPAFVIDGTLVPGAITLEMLEDLVGKARQS